MSIVNLFGLIMFVGLMIGVIRICVASMKEALLIFFGAILFIGLAYLSFYLMTL